MRYNYYKGALGGGGGGGRQALGHHSHFFLPGPLGPQHLIIVFFYRRGRTRTACFECTAVQFVHMRH